MPNRLDRLVMAGREILPQVLSAVAGLYFYQLQTNRVVAAAFNDDDEELTLMGLLTGILQSSSQTPRVCVDGFAEVVVPR